MLEIFLIVLVGLCIYLMPTLVAFGRKHHQRYAILALNVLLGCTGLGWIAALIWALTAVRATESNSPN